MRSAAFHSFERAELTNVPGLEVVVQDFGGEVGVRYLSFLVRFLGERTDELAQPVALHVSSAHLSVSSLVFIRISLLAPPPLDIISVTAFILQSFTVHCLSSPPPPRRH